MKTLHLLMMILLCSSCDCYRYIEGAVIDKSTGRPIKGATVFIDKQSDFNSLTDSTGTYRIRYIESGLKCYCTTGKEIIVEKQGYHSLNFNGIQKRSELEHLPLGFVDSTCISKPDTLDGQVVFSAADKMPVFPGGDVKFFDYINKNLRYPKFNAEDHFQTTVYATFIIDTLGNVRNPCIHRRQSAYFTEFEKEALKMIKAMPAWLPGGNNGKRVYSRIMLPVKFKLQD